MFDGYFNENQGQIQRLYLRMTCFVFLSSMHTLHSFNFHFSKTQIMSAPKILKLDEVVVNRIAAGEIIQRPANAIKEMIENCLDAKCTSVQITVKNGGLKYIQILDDGCGILKEDMGIVCERFTTSKLSSFDDLKSISTYGFRGEALASISHVAHLTITSRTSQSPCAFKAKYVDGKMVPLQVNGSTEARPCAGNKGTQIIVEDLFYNVAVRRKALKNANEEYARISDIISKYSIHNPSVAFTLKKCGENMAGIRTQKNMTVVDNIKSIYGPKVARELLLVSQDNQQFGFKMSGYMSNANYSMKKCVFLLFINHRLVESTSLRRALDAVYVNYLPKDKHPFMYMNLEINPLNVDVNVHPTKHEVKFLHEESIIEEIQRCVETKLLGANESRQFYTQTLLPKMVAAGIDQPTSDVIQPPSKSNESKKVYDHQLVRTDCRERKLQAFFSSKPHNETTNSTLENVSAVHTPIQDGPSSMETQETSPPIMEVNTPQKITPASHISSKRNRKEEKVSNGRTIKLTSVKNLRKQIDDNEHLGLKNLLEDHKFVGCVNPSLALVQHLTRLYLVNTRRLSQELFYQIMIFRFGQFGYLRLKTAAPLVDLLMIALDSPQCGWTPADGSKENLTKYAVDLLHSKCEMLMDYFSIEVNANRELVCLPLLVEKYVPDWNGLPMFLLRLATEVNWDNEQECFQTLTLECSRFYAFPEKIENDDAKRNDNYQTWQWTVEHVLYPAFRTSLLPTKRFAEDGTFLEVANLPDLYKVFERC